MKPAFPVAVVAAAFYLISCDPVAETGSDTDAVRQEIFHGHPKIVRSVTCPAYSSAGEWFKDTTVRNPPQAVFMYNLAGELTEEAHRPGDSLPAVAIGYRYTPGSPRKAAAVWTIDTTEVCRVAYRYDKDGRLIGTETTRPDGTVTGRDDYRLDSRGFRKEVRCSNGYGVLKRREVNEYNRAGELTGQDVYFYGGKDNNRHTVVRYTYQGNGLKASATVQDEHASPKEIRTAFSYEYDAQGNWIRRVAYNETLKTAEMTERKIEYYQ